MATTSVLARRVYNADARRYDPAEGTFVAGEIILIGEVGDLAEELGDYFARWHAEVDLRSVRPAGLSGARADEVELIVVDEDSLTRDVTDVVSEARRRWEGSPIAVIVTERPRVSDMVRTLIAGANFYAPRQSGVPLLAMWRQQYGGDPPSGRRILLDNVTYALRRTELSNPVVESVTELVGEALDNPDTALATSGRLYPYMSRALTSFGAALEPVTHEQARLAEETFGDLLSGEFRFSALERVGGGVGPLEKPAMGDQPPPPEAPEGSPAPLYWNTRFPGEDKLLAAGTVRVGDLHVLETALETRADAAATSTAINNPESLIGAEIRFELRGTGVSFCPDAEVKDSVFTDFLRSPPHPCTELGTLPFRVTCRVDRPGEVVIELDLVVRNGQYLDQTIRLKAEEPGPATMDQPDLATAPEPLPGQPTLCSRGPIDGDVTTRDIDLRLKVWADGEACRLECSSTLGLEWSAIAARGVAQIRAQAASLRAELAAVSRDYHRGEGGDYALEGAEESLLEFARIGSKIHEMIFGLPGEATEGQHERDSLAAAIAEAGRAHNRALLQISASEIPIPWGVVYDGTAHSAALLGQTNPYAHGPASGADVDLSCFWGRRFSVYRAVPGVRDVPTGRLGGLVKPVLNADLVGLVEHQRTLFSDPSGAPIQVDAIIEDPGAFLGWVGEGAKAPCDILYFFCHAGAPSEYSERGYPEPADWMWNAYFGLAGSDDTETSGRVTLAKVREKWRGLRERRPLVFLNACGSSKEDSVYGSPFVQHFFGTWQVRTLIGTDWIVPAAFADEFSRHLIRAWRQPRTAIIDAVREASDVSFAAGNPFPLVYALYGRNDVFLKTDA